MGNQGKNEYQHFIPKFLLRNFSDDHVNIYKNEDKIWKCCKIEKTGGADLFYGPPKCSLEMFFGHLETIVADTIKQQKKLSQKQEKYMKLFIQLMAYRSPSKNKMFGEEYSIFRSSIKMHENEVVHCLENEKQEFEMWIESFEKDFETKRIEKRHKKQFDDNDNSKFFPAIISELLYIVPRLDKFFRIHVFESDYDLVIGETPTISKNFTPLENISNEEKIEPIHRNVIHWLPVASNKVVFMYTDNRNIVAQKDRKLRKQDADILNYFQTKQNSFFYSRIPNLKIPEELASNFEWVKHFNYVFGYKNIFYT